MSRDSPRRPFSPVRPMSQSVIDRRRSSNYTPHPYDRPFTPNESNRPVESQPFRPGWEERDRVILPRSHSPSDSHRGRIPGLYDSSYEDDRSYRPVTPFRDATTAPFIDNPVTPGAMTPFRDRAVTPRAVPQFRDRAVTPGTVAPFRERPVTPSFSPDERPLGNDHWSPGASQPAGPSSAWEPRGQQRSWSSKPNVSPPFLLVRPNADTPQRAVLEPSQAWKQAKEERDRQLSIEFRTIIPADRRGLGPDGFASDGKRDGTPISVPMSSTQHSTDIPDFQARRFRQQPQPPPLPPRFEPRGRYPDRFQASDYPRHPQTDNSRRAPAFTTPRRPQHRISARISARPKRSPSPTSSDSSVSPPLHSRTRSRSRSRSTRSRVSSPERDLNRDHGSSIRRSSPSRRRSSELRTHPASSSPNQTVLRRSISVQSPPKSLPPSGPSPAGERRPQALSAPSGSFTFRSPEFVEPPRQHQREIPRLRSPSASSQSSQSSIRSSVHSSPALVATDISPDPHADSSVAQSTAHPASSRNAGSSVPSSWFPPQDDTEFELPGMRFQKDGALKPGFSPPSLKSGLDIQVDLVSAEPPQPDDARVLEITDSPSEIEVDELPQSIPHSPELTVARIIDSPFSPADKASPDLIQSPSLAPDDASIDGSTVDRSSPPAQVSPPGNLSRVDTQRQPGKRTILPRPKEYDASPNIQRAELISDINRPEISQVEPSQDIDLGSAALESSPLSEPVPLSPPPDIPGLQDDMDETSSMDIDDESASEPADNIAAALRVFVEAREGKDLQTRNERYEPILEGNHSFLDPSPSRISTSNDDVVREVMEGAFRVRLEAHSLLSQSLLDRFTKQAEAIAAKTHRLRAEYKLYHDRWVVNCRKLDQSMASSASQGVEGLPPPSGRVTRRSTNFGDAVRSDLEMEQIIASLGNEDMTDPNVLAIRNTAVIPDLISTEPFTIDFSYDDNNGLVDDPEDAFDVYDALGRWTDEEKETYIQNYGVYPKQFSVIASFLPDKTPAQCVMFYYLHKKELVDFRAAISKYGPKRKRRGGRKAGKGKGNALLADMGKPASAQGDEEGGSHKHSDRFGAVPNFDGRRFPSRLVRMVQNDEGESSRPLSDTAARGSRVAALQQEDGRISDVDSGRSNKQRQSPRIPGSKSGRPSPSEDGGETGTVIVAPPEDRRKRQARFVGPKDTVPEENLPQESPKKPKPAGKGKEKEKRPPGRPPKKNKDRGKTVDKDTGSSLPQKTTYVWSKGEEASYVVLVGRHGKDFEKIAAEMPAKTAVQCRNYFRNHAKELDLERIAKETDKSTSVDESAASKISSGSATKDKGISKSTKLKDIATGEGDTGASSASRGQRSRQPGSSTDRKGKEKQTSSSDRISAALNAIFMSPAAAVPTTKETANSRRLPSFTKNRRQETQPKD